MLLKRWEEGLLDGDAVGEGEGGGGLESSSSPFTSEEEEEEEEEGSKLVISTVTVFPSSHSSPVQLSTHLGTSLKTSAAN
jgi:hypothetical protein